MVHRVSRVEQDSFSGELYWRQDEIIARFVGVEADILSLVDANLRLNRIVDVFDDDPSYSEGYRDALKDYTDGLALILRSRFKEIVFEIEKK